MIHSQSSIIFNIYTLNNVTKNNIKKTPFAEAIYTSWFLVLGVAVQGASLGNGIWDKTYHSSTKKMACVFIAQTNLTKCAKTT